MLTESFVYLQAQAMFNFLEIPYVASPNFPGQNVSLTFPPAPDATPKPSRIGSPVRRKHCCWMKSRRTFSRALSTLPKGSGSPICRHCIFNMQVRIRGGRHDARRNGSVIMETMTTGTTQQTHPALRPYWTAKAVRMGTCAAFWEAHNAIGRLHRLLFSCLYCLVKLQRLTSLLDRTGTC